MFRPIMAIVRFLYRLRGVYISEWGCVDVEISMHQFPVALLSSADGDHDSRGFEQSQDEIPMFIFWN